MKADAVLAHSEGVEELVGGEERSREARHAYPQHQVRQCTVSRPSGIDEMYCTTTTPPTSGCYREEQGTGVTHYPEVGLQN